MLHHDTDVVELTDLQRRQQVFAQLFNLTLDEYIRIMRVSTTEEAVVIMELMKVKKHRASYRSKCHNQVREWLARRGTGKPLSPTQYVYLKPTWKITWRFPTNECAAYTS